MMEWTDTAQLYPNTEKHGAMGRRIDPSSWTLTTGVTKGAVLSVG